MKTKSETIHNIAKDIVKNVITRSLTNIRLTENMNNQDKPLTPIIEETDSDIDKTNAFTSINESALIEVYLDNDDLDIELDTIIKNIQIENKKREKNNRSVVNMLKRYCCYCIKK